MTVCCLFRFVCCGVWLLWSVLRPSRLLPSLGGSSFSTSYLPFVVTVLVMARHMTLSFTIPFKEFCRSLVWVGCSDWTYLERELLRRSGEATEDQGGSKQESPSNLHHCLCTHNERVNNKKQVDINKLMENAILPGLRRDQIRAFSGLR